ncbi:hypothetical protein RRF57_006289 [Xylaria bambusicola]|uniref:Uncharacterized protein n=1 Tax=Xylaria bambusicola TaxID=326684 RepID=A0AAN7UZ60_9PEZI
MALQSDIVPVGVGHFFQPAWQNSPANAVFPVLDKEVVVELRPQALNKKWNATYSESDEAMSIISEDLATDGN